MPSVSEELGPFENNVAGQRLLPNLQPHDWPCIDDITAAQQSLPPATREKLAVTHTHSGAQLLTDQAGKIVLPSDNHQLIAAICAAAHQGKHGHVKAAEMRRKIEECFTWKGARDDIKKWGNRCLQ